MGPKNDPSGAPAGAPTSSPKLQVEQFGGVLIQPYVPCGVAVHGKGYFKVAPASRGAKTGTYSCQFFQTDAEGKIVRSQLSQSQVLIHGDEILEGSIPDFKLIGMHTPEGDYLSFLGDIQVDQQGAMRRVEMAGHTFILGPINNPYTVGDHCISYRAYMIQDDGTVERDERGFRQTTSIVINPRTGEIVNGIDEIMDDVRRLTERNLARQGQQPASV